MPAVQVFECKLSLIFDCHLNIFNYIEFSYGSATTAWFELYIDIFRVMKYHKMHPCHKIAYKTLPLKVTQLEIIESIFSI